VKFTHVPFVRQSATVSQLAVATPVPKKMPDCKSERLRNLGWERKGGTEIKNYFFIRACSAMGPETTGLKILSRSFWAFHRHHADIQVGTQMV
jgi:primosomal protein N'